VLCSDPEETSTSENDVLAAAVPTAKELVSVTEARDWCRALTDELSESTKTALAEAEMLFTAVRRAAVSRQDEVVAEIRAEESRKRSLLTTSIDSFHRQRDYTQAGLALVKGTLDVATPMALLGLRHTLITGLHRLERHGIDLTPPCTANLGFKSTRWHDEALKSIGKIGAVTETA
jgi:hypothetical protein